MVKAFCDTDCNDIFQRKEFEMRYSLFKFVVVLLSATFALAAFAQRRRTVARPTRTVQDSS